MTATKIGVIYGAVSKVIRTVIVPDSDAQLTNWPLRAGESLAQLDKATHPDLASMQLAIGPPSFSGRCCVVDVGAVISVVQADPLIDAIPGKVLAGSDMADVGWTYSAGIFTSPVDAKTGLSVTSGATSAALS